MVRSGRRPGESGSREVILSAARERFARLGFDGTTIRGIAQDAAVDPGMVHHFFGTKDGIFAAAMELPIDAAVVIPALLDEGLDGLGERLLRFFLSLWENPASRLAMSAILRSAVSQERAAALLRGFVGREVIGRLAQRIDRPEPELRATLVGSQLLGLALIRYVIRVEPLASAPAEAVVAAVAPTLQRYLTEALDNENSSVVELRP